MRKIFKYISIAVIAVSLTSCLEKLPKDGIPADKAIRTVEDVKQAVVGIYSTFKSGSLYSGYLTLLPEIQTDLVYAVNGYSNTYGDMWRWDILGTNNQIVSVWAALYNVINRCNFLLDAIPAIERRMTDDDKLDELYYLAGEAYFARALAYSELVKLWCKPYKGNEDDLGVILTEHYNDKSEKISRSTLRESYEFIIRDLEKAEDRLMPEEDDQSIYYDSEYFSVYSVWALRSRLALYMEDWDNAVKYSGKVIDSGKFILSSCNSQQYSNDYNDYEYMWQLDHSTEVIWKVGFTPTSYGGSLGRIFFNYDYYSFKPDYVPAQWVLNLYEESDGRATSFFEMITTGYSHGLSWPLVIKYFGNNDFIDTYNILHVNMPKVFRLSEQYLIRAEAYIEQENYSDASKDITALRAARYKSPSSPSLGESNAKDFIEQERVRELFMEGFRFMDLKRWHKGFTRTPQEQSLENGSSLKIEADAPLFVWPIPSHELNAPGSNVEPNESNR